MRKLMWFAIGFCLACAVGAYFYISSFWILGAMALILAVIAFVFVRKMKMLRVAGCVLLAFSIGVGWFCAYDANYLCYVRGMDAKTEKISITVSDYSTKTDYSTNVTGKISVNGRDYTVLLYLNEEESLSPGDVVSGKFRIRFTAFGGAKEPTYHSGKGIFLLAYQSGTVNLEKADVSSSRFTPAAFRKAVIDRIDAIFNGTTAAFCKALLMGDRSGIDYELNTAFKLSGISHIVAVSGLHVSMMFGIVTLLFGRRRWLTGIIGLPVLLLFAAMMNFIPSVSRACIMQAMILMSNFVDREYDGPTALALSALIMVVCNPMVVTSVSFQLSFACVIGIMLFCEKIYKWLLGGRGKGKGILPGLWRWFAGSVSVSLSALALTTPLIAYYFGAVSLVSVLTNLLVVWLLPFIFAGVLLACVLSLFLPQIATLFVAVTSALVHFVLDTAVFVSKLPFSAVYTASDYIVLWLIFSYLMLAVFLLMRRKRVLVFVCLVTISLCGAVCASIIEPMTDRTRVTVLNVGQGQSILLQGEGKSFLVDCGGDSRTASADLAAETLLSQGVYHLDGLILTHYDKDHAAGAANLVDRIDIDRVYLPLIEDDYGYGQNIRESVGDAVINVDGDMKLSFGDALITIYGPETYNLSNDSGLCVLFQHENCDILITGDRGSLGEALLLNRTDLPKLDVLIAGHHGSNGSTGEALLAATEPEYVFISVSDSNPYGHPAEKLLERLYEFGCIVYRTDIHGTIIFRR